MPPNPFEPDVNVFYEDVLYQSIGRSIDQLVKYHYLTQVNPEIYPNDLCRNFQLHKINGEINKLVTHRVERLLSGHGTQPQYDERILRLYGPPDRSINTIVKDGLIDVLTAHGYTAQPRPPRPGSQSDVNTIPSNPDPIYYRPPSVPPPLDHPRDTPEQQRLPHADHALESNQSQMIQDQPISEPQPPLHPAAILQPSPIIPESSHIRQESETSNSTHGSQSEMSNSSDESEGDVDMPFLSPEDIPSPNYMFDMPGSDEESEEEDPTISDPNHPNYRPLFTYEPLDRDPGGPFAIIPPRRPEPPSPDAAPATP
jgi:hypothetical protein